MLKIYLAARYSRRLELRKYARELVEKRGFEVTSRWLGDVGDVADGFAAIMDYNDVRDAQVLIAFTEGPDVCATRGGRHVEFGIALGCGLRIIIIGPRENVFCHLPGIEQVDDWSQVTDEMITLWDPEQVENV